MKFYQTFLFRLLLVLCAALLFFPRLGAAFTPKRVIFESLRADTMLSAAQQKRLREVAGQLKADEQGLEEIALAVSSKIRRDVKHLSSLTFYLLELSENKYAQKVGKVRQQDIEKIQAYLKELEEDAKNIYKHQSLKENRPNGSQYVKIIKHDISLLSGEKGRTPGRLWQMIKAEYKQSYKKWNRHYRQLEASFVADDDISEVYGLKTKKKFFEVPVRSSQEYIQQTTKYTLDQLNFMRDFSHAQEVFRRLSKPNSSDF